MIRECGNHCSHDGSTRRQARRGEKFSDRWKVCPARLGRQFENGTRVARPEWVQSPIGGHFSGPLSRPTLGGERLSATGADLRHGRGITVTTRADLVIHAGHHSRTVSRRLDCPGTTDSPARPSAATKVAFIAPREVSRSRLDPCSTNGSKREHCFLHSER